jgi:hypothetical protein
MSPRFNFTISRRLAIAMAAAACLAAPLASHAQKLEEITYLLPAPGGCWRRPKAITPPKAWM